MHLTRSNYESSNTERSDATPRACGDECRQQTVHSRTYDPDCTSFNLFWLATLPRFSLAKPTTSIYLWSIMRRLYESQRRVPVFTGLTCRRSEWLKNLQSMTTLCGVDRYLANISNVFATLSIGAWSRWHIDWSARRRWWWNRGRQHTWHTQQHASLYRARLYANQLTGQLPPST